MLEDIKLSTSFIGVELEAAEREKLRASPAFGYSGDAMTFLR